MYLRHLACSLWQGEDRLHPTSFSPPPSEEPLSEREREVLRLIATDLSGPEIARNSPLAAHHAKVHTRNIYGKLGVKSRHPGARRAEALSHSRNPAIAILHPQIAICHRSGTTPPPGLFCFLPPPGGAHRSGHSSSLMMPSHHAGGYLVVEVKQANMRCVIRRRKWIRAQNVTTEASRGRSITWRGGMTVRDSYQGTP